MYFKYVSVALSGTKCFLNTYNTVYHFIKINSIINAFLYSSTNPSRGQEAINLAAPALCQPGLTMPTQCFQAP